MVIAALLMLIIYGSIFLMFGVHVTVLMILIVNLFIPKHAVPVGTTILSESMLADDCGIDVVRVPDGIKEISPVRRFRANLVEELHLPEGLELIGGKAFSYGRFETVELPESLHMIGWATFSYSRLTRITLPCGLQAIAPFAFYRTLLRSVEVPAGVMLGRNAFACNHSMLWAIVHTSSDQVEIFGECCNLKYLVTDDVHLSLPAWVTVLPNTTVNRAFVLGRDYWSLSNHRLCCIETRMLVRVCLLINLRLSFTEEVALFGILRHLPS